MRSEAGCYARLYLESSFDEVLQRQLEQIPELRQVEGDLTSPYVKAEDLDPAVMEILKDLPLNQPSEPSPYQGAWYIFEVTNVRRQRLSEEDYRLKSPSYEKILYNRKAMELGTAFVAETMKPLNVSTKRAGFEILNRALFDWYSNDTPERNLLHYIEEGKIDAPYAKLLSENYDELLVTYRDANWTIRDFLTHFTPGRYVIRPDDEQAFKARLADIIAIVVRDAVLLDLADNENLRNDEVYQRTVALWKSQWMFQEYRNRFEAGQPGVMSTIAHAKSLMPEYDVEINWTMLDTLKTNVLPSNPTMTTHLFKNNANKMPFPIADPNWRPAE